MKKFAKIATLVFALMLPINSLANETGAKNFVKSVGDKTIAILKKDLAEDKKQAKLESLFVKSVDIDWIGKFALGRYWREASKEQKQNYQKHYKRFLINSYVPKFKSYTNQKLVIKNSKAEDKNEYLVETLISSDEAQDVRVDYKVRKAGNSYKIFDVIAEGVSLITTQRSDFGSIASRNGIDDLISKLESKSKVANNM